MEKKLQQSEQEAKPGKQDARFHLANERTLLAWIRTSIGIMAFGFVVVKFSLFIKQVGIMIGREIPVSQNTYSSVIGIILVAVGAIVLVLAYVKYKQTEQRILDDNYQPSSRLALIITFTIFITSILLIIYLIGNSF